MAVKIAIANQKGGVGKTTSAYNLAASKAIVGRKTVLMIDMDPQSNLLESCAMVPDDPEYDGFSTCTLFEENVDPLDCCFAVESIGEDVRLFIVPSTINLSLTAKELYTKEKSIQTFKKHIQTLDSYFDYIFFDCPPSLDELLLASLISADGVIIPTKMEKLSYGGIKLILSTIHDVQASDNGNKNLTVYGLIATMYRAQVIEHQQLLEQMAQENQLLGVIPLSAVVTKGYEFGQPVVFTHPSSKAAKAYINIANQL